MNILSRTTVTQKRSPLFEAEQQAHRRTGAKLSIAVRHLSNFLDEFEGAWDNEHECASPEIAQQYIEAAKFMSDHFKRINNRILEIEQWYNKFVPEDLQKP